MKIYTDRFETALPPELRERFRGRFCYVVEDTKPLHGLVDTNLSVKPEPVLPEAPRALPKLSTLLEPPEGKKTPWALLAWSVIVLLLGGVFLMTYERVRQNPQVTVQSTPEPTPVHIVVPDPTPEPELVPVPIPPDRTAAMQEELIRAATPAVSPEGAAVRRAESQVQMPYGETMWARVLGRLPDQEHLPLIGNSVGDAYLIGPHEFVWTESGQWIDPVQAHAG
jgi:hypothetical protein